MVKTDHECSHSKIQMRVAAFFVVFSLRLRPCWGYYYREAPDSEFDIWIIGGQSNAVGTNGWVRDRN